MKKILFGLMLLSGLTFGQSSTQPQRAMYGTTSEIQSYPGLSGVFIRYNFNSRSFGVYAKDATDTTSPASDSVIVSTTGVRFKLLADESNTSGGGGGSVAWGDITGKPSTFTPSSHNQAISTVTGLQDSLDAKQPFVTAGTALQYWRGDKTWQTLDNSSVGLGSVRNIDATNASNLSSGAIPAARFGNLTVPPSAISQGGGTTGQVLKWNGSAWIPSADNEGAAPTLAANTFYGNKTGGSATAAAMSVSESKILMDITGVTTAIVGAKSDTTHRHTAAHLTSGIIPAGRYGTGTIPVLALNATGSTADTAVLRRNGTWAVISGGGGGTSGLADTGGNGIVVRTSVGVTTPRSMGVSGDGLSISNANGTGGNPTYSLINDMGAIEALTGTGIAKRTGTDTWSLGGVALGSEVTGILPAANGGAGTVSGVLKANGSGTVSAAVAGTDYLTPTGSAASLTGFPTFNQNTTGTASNVTGTVAVANGGTGATSASQARTNLGAGTVSSVSGTGTVSGLTLSGTVTGTGSLTLGGTLAVGAANFGSQTANTFLAAPNGSSGTPTFRAIVAADVPTLNQNTTGTAANLSGTPTLPNGTAVATQTTGDNTTKIANTAFVNTAIIQKVSYKTISELKAFTATDVINMPRVYITDAGKEGEFRYVAGSSASDNVGTLIVTTSGGYRYQRVYQGAVYASWFRDAADAAGATQDRNAINRAVQFALAESTIPTVIINQGVWRVDNNAIYCNVPLNKTLKIRGEGGAIIDFLATGTSDTGQDAVFRTGNSWTWPGQTTAKVYGSISGDTLNVTYVRSGTLKLGQLIFNGNIRSSTKITQLLSGSGTTGTYRVSRSQTAAADTVFANASMLGWTNGDRIILYGSIDIANLEFYGGRSTTVNGASSGYSRPMLFRQCQNVNINNCLFRNIIGSGFAIGVSDGGTISGNRFESVYAREPINDATGDAITLYAYCQNFTITGNVAILDSAQSGRCGISVDDCSRNCSVTGNTIEGYERAIHVETSAFVTVVSNAISKSPVGIITAQNHEGVVVSNNIIDASSIVFPSTLGYTAHLFAYEDNGTVFQNNTVTGGLQTQNSRYIGKFWGINMVVKNNTFKNTKIIHSAINRVTSTTSNTIPANLNTPVSHTYTYTSNPNLVWQLKQRIRAFNSTYVYVEGYITAVSATSVTIQLDNYNSSGTYSSWTLQYVDMGPVLVDGYNDDNEFSGNTFEFADLSLNSTTRNLVKGNIFKSSYCAAQSSTNVRIINNEFLPAYKETLGRGINVYGATKPFVSENKLRDPVDYVIQQDASTGGKFYSNIYTRTNSSAAGLSYFFVNTGLSSTGAQKTPLNFRNCIVDEYGNENYYVNNTGTPTAY